MKNLREWLNVIIPTLTLVIGMAWAGGSRDQRQSNIERDYGDLKAEVVKLRDAVNLLATQMARQEQRLEDDAK